MRLEVDRAIVRTTYVSLAMGAILSPIPLADELLLVPTYALLAVRIGQLHGLPPSRVPWRPIATTVLSGLAARAALNLTVAFIPGVAAVANAVSAAGLTRLLGRHMDASCADPSQARPLSPEDIAAALRRGRAGNPREA